MDPVGPLPASVYWRRRAAVAGIALLALVALLWAAWSLLPSGSEEQARPAARSAELAPPAPTGPAPAEPVPAAAPPVPGAAPTPAAPHPSGPAAPAAPAGAPGGPVPCADHMIQVRAEPGQPAYPAGAPPELRLVVTNVSGQPCVRDLDGALQEISVWSADGATKIWSSNDCTNPSAEDPRTLDPGRPLAFAVTWSGLASEPGCAAERSRVPPGGYRVLARLGPVTGPPAALLLS